MPTLLTSYLYKGVELNDNINFLIPATDLALDDRNSVDATWAYRKDNVPVQTQLTIKEGVFVLNILLKAVYGETGAQFETKLNLLKQLFNTRDAATYQLQRRLPHEATYKFLNVSAREFSANRIERKVSVTFQTAERVWQETALQTSSKTLFAGAPRTETLVINYTGLDPVEPVITVQALTAGSDGPVPLYYRDVVTYVHSDVHIVNSPFRIVAGWNTSSLVSGGKMRSDGFDINVALPDGTVLRRYIGGSAASRSIWVNPQVWPHWSTSSSLGGTIGMGPTDTSILVQMYDGDIDFPASGTFMLDDEVVAYSSWSVFSADFRQVMFTLSARGVSGTTAASHSQFTPLKRPVTLRVSYGYAAGYLRAWGNVMDDWFLMDYDSSDNTNWVQSTANTWALPASGSYTQTRGLVWTGVKDPLAYRSGEVITAREDSDPRLGHARMQMSTAYDYAYRPSATRERIVFQPPTYLGRQPTYMRFILTLRGNAAAPFTVKFVKVRSGYFQSYESYTELYSYTQSVVGPTTIDTGYLYMDHWWKPGTHYYFRIDNAPPGAGTVSLHLDTAYILPDQDYNKVPVALALGAEGGASTGEYPTFLSSIRNLNDAGNPQAFSLATRQSTGQIATIDCAERSVSGMGLNECSFQNPTWLRLLPGSNTIQFIGPTGAGQMAVTVSWRNRY